MARRKIVAFVAGLAALCVALAVGLGGCRDMTFNGDMKGFLEYWTATLGVSNPQVPPEDYQIDSSGRMTISTGEAVTVTATVENPDGHAVNGGVGPSSDILKSVRISGEAGDIALSSGPRVTVSLTSLTLELPPLSPVPTEETRRAEHKDFTVLLAPVRTETNMSPSSPLSLTFRYNTPPGMPQAVKEDGGSFRWPRKGENWDASSGSICWAWPKDKTKAGGGSAADPDYAAYFSIYDGVTSKLEAEVESDPPESTLTKDGIEYNVYKATGLSPTASVKVYAEDGDRVRGEAAVSGEIHTITLHGNGGTFGNGSAPSATMYAGAGSTIKVGNLETPSYPGLSLSGWSDKPSGGQPFDFPPTMSGDLELYAQWRGNTYTVTFDDGSGAGGPGSLTAAYNQAPPPLPSVPTRTGYTFGGYFTQPDGGGTQYYDGSGAPQGTWREPQHTTLHAKWTANTYTVKFYANGGSGNMNDQQFTYDAAQKLTANAFSPTPNYEFVGWNTAANGTGDSYENDQSVSNLTADPNGAVILYAQWGYEEPQKAADGTTYEVSNAGNLLWIGQQINNGQAANSIKVVLTADIVIPSGEWQPCDFTGHLDGRNHSITLNEDWSASETYAKGLFSYIRGAARVENLVLKGSIKANVPNDQSHGGVGSVAGKSYGGTIRNVMSLMNITNVYLAGYAGGLLGFAGQSEAEGPSTMENCAVYADVTASNGGYAGGFVGKIWGGTRIIVVKDSVYMGTVDGDAKGGIVAGYNNDANDDSKFTNIYYCDKSASGIGIVGITNKSPTETNVVPKTEQEIASTATENLLNTGLQSPQWEFVNGKYPTLKTTP